MPSTDTAHDNHDKDEASTQKEPAYTSLEPQCPVCGNTKYSSTSEDAPHNVNSHYVNVTCARCHTSFTVEFRAIDVSWYGARDDQHSAVSQGLFTPNSWEYVEDSNYSGLPDRELLWELDWPHECDCGEWLTGNDILGDPDLLTEHGVTYDNPDNETVLFQCVNCGEVHTRSPPAEV